MTGRAAIDEDNFTEQDVDAVQPAVADLLPDELDAFAEQIRRLKSPDSSHSLEDAVTLASLERRLRSHAETHRDSAFPAMNGSRAVIAEIEHWKDVCGRMGLAGIVEETDRLLTIHADRTAENWKEMVSPVLNDPQSEICFQHLMRTTTLQLEYQDASRQPGSVLKTLSEVRRALRLALLEAVRRHPPDEKVRQAWVTQLLDMGNIVMTSIDDLSPKQAAEQISIAVDDCHWHFEHMERKAFGKPRRQLRRKIGQLRAERQERLLQHRLENQFGRRMVGASERIVLVLIFVVIGLMMAEFFFPLSSRMILWFNIIDACACGVFLTEFFTKLRYVSGRRLWFRRHFLIDFVPSIPFALLTSGMTVASPADAVRLGRLARLLRLPRLVRYVRILRPVIRVLRGVGMLARGLDRLARRYGHLLNQNVILYPTRAELDRYRSSRPIGQIQTGRLCADLGQCWNQMLVSASETIREQIANARLEVLRTALSVTAESATVNLSLTASQTREIPAGILIYRLQTATPHELESRLAEPLLAQLARIVGIYSRPPMRWLPLISSCIPHVSDDMSNSEVTSAAARRLAGVLKKCHDAWFWFADLYGTVSPSQFVDRVGTMLVNSSFRPAYRLALFGGFLLLTQLALYVTALTALEPLERFLGRFVGTPVLILGGICILVLAVGWWLKGMAREATEFYERSAQAQYLSLMETVRCRYLERDTEILVDRVLRPELIISGKQSCVSRTDHIRRFQDRVRQSLLDDARMCESKVIYDGVEITALLYRDWLDGALLTESDTRATSQLLGNPAVRQFLSLSQRFSAKEVKAMHKLDLVRQKSLLGGPYLWFNFISRSIAHSVACLLVNYNQNAIPKAELSLLTPDEHKRYYQWLTDCQTKVTEASRDIEQQAEQNYVTTAFSAVHFLDDHPRRDQEIEASFGTEVLNRLRTDRSLLIRRVFGAYPMHDRPKEQRVVNLYSIYSSWLAGGRALLLPLFLLIAMVRFMRTLLAWISKSIQEIRRPELRRNSDDAANSHFSTAVRKIERIRGPVVQASMRLRSRTDPEFLGVALPGQEESDLRGADYDSDFAFLCPKMELIAELEQERARARADMQRLDSLIKNGLLQRVASSLGLDADALTSREHVQAAAVVYLADVRQVRCHLSAREILDDAYRMAATLPLMSGRVVPRGLLKRKFACYWRQHGFGDTWTKRAAWRATLNNYWGVADALLTWHECGDDALEKGEKILGLILVHPYRITQQLAAIRTIQSLAVLDVLHYRQHVYHLGRYADTGDLPGDLLRWKTVLTE